MQNAVETRPVSSSVTWTFCPQQTLSQTQCNTTEQYAAYSPLSLLAYTHSCLKISTKPATEEFLCKSFTSFHLSKKLPP